MAQHQINITPLELAAIHETLNELVLQYQLDCTAPVRICRDDQNVIHVYGPDGEIETINPNNPNNEEAIPIYK